MNEVACDSKLMEKMEKKFEKEYGKAKGKKVFNAWLKKRVK